MSTSHESKIDHVGGRGRDIKAMTHSLLSNLAGATTAEILL
jgi:hypothetical protein